jgi:hypothetical protein
MKRLLSLVALLAGCGGAPASVQGNYQGAGFSVGDAISITGTAQDMNLMQVNITTASNACNRVLEQNAPKNGRLIGLSITSPSVIQGTLQVKAPSSDQPINGLLVQAMVVTFDATCSAKEDFATDGTITIAHSDSSGVTGSFDLKFASGDHLTGDFSAPQCSLSKATVPPPPSTCS